MLINSELFYNKLINESLQNLKNCLNHSNFNQVLDECNKIISICYLLICSCLDPNLCVRLECDFDISDNIKTCITENCISILSFYNENKLKLDYFNDIYFFPLSTHSMFFKLLK